MNYLAIETSTKHFSLAVARGGKVVTERNVLKDKILSSSIVPEIERALKKAKVPLAKIDGFIVGLGPGSFTSLRVGLSTVKALSLATGKPIIGIPSLDTIAYNVRKQDTEDVCVVTDARRQMVYSALYRRQKGSLKRQSKYLLTTADNVLQKIQGRTVFTGDAVDIFRAKITAHNGICEDKKYWPPRAKSLWELAKPRIEKRQFDDIDRLLPLYLYPEDCQVKP